MHMKRRLRRVLRANGTHERTAPLPLGAGVDAFALNAVGLGAEALLLRRFLVRRPARRLDRR